MKTKLFMLFLIHMFLQVQCYSQKILVNGQESNGKLNWSNFTGKIDKSSSFNAYTSYKFFTKFQGINFIGDSAIMNGFEIILELDPNNSWAKNDKVTDALLIHEQGHFNLGILCVREILNKYKETKFTRSNYKVALQGIISDASKKYNDLGLLYDKETDHSKNIEEQLKWNKFFSGNGVYFSNK